MNSIELLLNRRSNPSLSEPAPDAKSLNQILLAGMRVPDHGCLTPWHYTVVQGAGLERLSHIFKSTLLPDSNGNVDSAKQDKLSNMPFRAPMIIIVSTRYREHAKVPKQEQLIAAGCGVHAMQMAAFSLGFGAMWRTGELSYHCGVKKALEIKESDDIVGFLYIGSESKSISSKTTKSYNDYVSFL